MRLFLTLASVFLLACSQGERERNHPSQTISVVFLDFQNTKAPSNFAEATGLALKGVPMTFEQFGNLSPKEHKEWFFKNGGISTPILVGEKAYGLSDNVIFDKDKMQVFVCDLGRRLQILKARELRRMDDAGLDTSVIETELAAFRTALGVLEKELQAGQNPQKLKK
jgi:hypothetical protein